MEIKSAKNLVIPLVSLAIFLLLIFGATYAYFESETNFNTANYELGLPQTTTLVCAATNCSTTVTPAMMLDTNTNSTSAKRSSSCYMNCTCTGTQGAKCNYNVTLLETGSPYVPSSGLGSLKEFTVKVTSPSGCTVQNSSSTESQLNTKVGKIVSKCSLTVPASGTVSANVTAQFKFYNQNIDQSGTAGFSYRYDLTTENKMIIYRNSTTVTQNGNNISVLDGDYILNANDFVPYHYIKHVVMDNIITETYVCARLPLKDGRSIPRLYELCTSGGDGGANYGTYTGISSSNYNTSNGQISGATGRIADLSAFSTAYGIGDVNGGCTFSTSQSSCSSIYYSSATSASVLIYATGESKSGTLSANSKYCTITSTGSASCEV